MTLKTDTPVPPGGYVYAGLLVDEARAKNWGFGRLLLFGNLLALIPLAIGIALLWLPYQFYIFLGLPFAQFAEFTWSPVTYIISGALLFVGSMFLHEATHGLALKLTGHRPRLSVHRGFLTATIDEDDFLSRRHYMFLSLTPVVIISLLGGIGLLFLPHSAGRLLLVILLLNLAASTGDFVVAIWLLRKPPETLFADNGHIHTYVPKQNVGNAA